MPEWKTKVGSSTAVRWPARLGGKGSESVADIVAQNPGAIGQVEVSDANVASLGHAPLPPEVRKMVLERLAAIH